MLPNANVRYKQEWARKNQSFDSWRGWQAAIDLAPNGCVGDVLTLILFITPTSRCCRSNWKCLWHLSSKAAPIHSRFTEVDTVEREIQEAGGDAYAIGVDVRDVDSVTKMVNSTMKVRHLSYPTTSIWPVVFIQSAATGTLSRIGSTSANQPSFLAMLTKSSMGLLNLNEDFLTTRAGVTDFAKYGGVRSRGGSCLLDSRIWEWKSEMMRVQGSIVAKLSCSIWHITDNR